MALRPPFSGNNQAHLFLNIDRFAPASMPPEHSYSTDLLQLSHWMMQKDPRHRPAAIDVYAHLTNNLPARVSGADGQPFVDARLAAKTFGDDKLQDEGARMPLAVLRSLGEPQPPAAHHINMGFADKSDMYDSTFDSTSTTVDALLEGVDSLDIGNSNANLDLDKINAALASKNRSGEDYSISLSDMLVMRALPDQEREQAKATFDALAQAASPHAVDVDFVLAKLYFESVQPGATAMHAALVQHVGESISDGSVKDLPGLEACIRRSIPLSPQPWLPADGLQQKELRGLLRDEDDLNILENWLLLKVRQELLEWNWHVLERYFQMVANREISTAVDRALAIDVARYMSKNKTINSLVELEMYLNAVVNRHQEAFAWKPTNIHAENDLMRYYAPSSSAGIGANPDSTGFWLKLKIRQELCAFDAFQPSAFTVSL